jgi:arylsulfatase A-like enzyme
MKLESSVEVQHPVKGRAILLAPVSVLILAVWFGVLTGLGELAYVAFKIYFHQMIYRDLPELIWMLPLTDVVLLGMPGLILAVAAWLRPQLGSLRLVTFVYLSMAVLCWLAHFKGLAWYARLLLAFGIGMQAARLVGKYPWFLRRLIQWSTGWCRPWALWHRQATVPMDEGAGSEPLVERRQMLVASAATLTGLAAGVYGWQRVKEWRALASLPPADPTMPNVLFLVWDSVRAQNLSLHGYGRPTTPNLERLARQGVSFRRAIAGAPWTLPSHAGMFTGRLLGDTRVNFGVPYTAPYTTLAEQLGFQGYQTAAFIGNHINLCPAFGLDRGFSRYESISRSPGQIMYVSQLVHDVVHLDRVRQVRGYPNDPGRIAAGDLNQSLLDWLDGRDRSRPYFAFINYFDAHSPYIPPKGMAGRFGVPAPRNPNPVEDLYEILSAAQLNAYEAAYDECILHLDSELGRLVDTLRQRGELENTVLIITADHGDHIGEHTLMGHSYTLYIQLLHVPLVVLHPGRIPAGQSVAQPVSLLNLPTTIWDLIGLGQQKPFPGESMASLWQREGTVPRSGEHPVIAEVNPPGGWSAPPNYPVSRGPMKSLVWRDFHYIRNGDGIEELYHREDDLRQENNLARSAKARKELDFLRTALAARLS